MTYQGVDLGYVDVGSERGKGDYVLHIASKLPHKKTEWLLRQWLLLQQKKVALPQLRVVGELDLASSSLVADSSGIEFLAPLNRADLLQAMQEARALLLPSEIEGFGLPAIEAYTLGTPVAYVQGTAVEEILGKNSPGGFRLTDDSLGSAVGEVLAMSTAEVREKNNQLRDRFSWQRCADLTVSAYRSLS